MFTDVARPRPGHDPSHRMAQGHRRAEGRGQGHIRRPAAREPVIVAYQAHPRTPDNHTHGHMICHMIHIM